MKIHVYKSLVQNYGMYFKIQSFSSHSSFNIFILSQNSGETGHFTNFALLLDPSNPDCASGVEEYLFVYLSAGFIGASIICVFFVLLAIEIQIRMRDNSKEEKIVIYED